MPEIPSGHSLQIAEVGGGKRPGKYLCECGETWTNVKSYRMHLKDVRRHIKAQEFISTYGK